MNTTPPNAFAELERLRRRVRERALRHGLLGWFAVAAPAATAAVWLAGGEHMGGGFIATGLCVSLVAGLAVAAWHQLWRPWRRYARAAAFARTVEACGDFDNVVVASEEATRRPERWATGDVVGSELVRRLDARATAALATLTPARVHPAAGARWRWLSLGLGLLAAILLAAGSPATCVRGLALLAAPWGAGPAGPGGGLFAEPAASWVAAGGSLALGAADFAREPGAVKLEVRFGDAAWTRIDAQPAPVSATATGAAGAPAGALRRWQATVADVREDFAWRFRRGDDLTPVARVTVRQAPLLTALAARVEAPSYMGLPPVTVERLPAVSEVPAGSRVTLTGRAGHELAAAWLAIAGGDSLPLRVEGDKASTVVTVERDLAFTVGLRDPYGLVSRDPLGYRLTVLADQPPAVTLTRPQDDGLLPLDGKLTLLVEATDDFGLRRLDLWVHTGDGQDASAQAGHTVRIGPRAATTPVTLATGAGDLAVLAREAESSGLPLRAALVLDLDAAGLDLVPGDVLELAVEARDNRIPGDGQLARSAVLRLALPSAGDALAAQAEAQERSRGELEEARRRERLLDADLQRLSRELLKNPLPDWARQQEIEAALQRQQALQKELARVAEDLQRQLDQLAGGQLTSEAQLQRAEQLSELLQQPAGEELTALLEKLTQPQGQASPDDVTRALSEVARSQQDLERRLDAAMALMKRLADEQRMEGLTSLLEDLMRRQQELADASRELAESGDRPRPDGGRQPESPPTDRGKAGDRAAELARKQEALAREMEQLREKLEQALAEQQQGQRSEDPSQSDSNKSDPSQSDPKAGSDPQSGSPSPQEQALREALDRLKQEQSSANMDQARKALQQMNPEQAAQMQQQALRDLGRLYSVLLASQQSMQAALKMEQVSSLRGLASDLLALSERQEELGGRIPAQLQDTRNVELTRQQHRLQKAAIGTRDRLNGMLAEAPNRILKLLEKLDALIEEMGGGVRALDEGRAAAAREYATRSLAEANRIVIGLLTEAQMAGGGGGGGGQQQSASEQLQELARQQAELNGVTEELRRMLADRGLSQDLRSRMQRLGQQQAQLGQELRHVDEEERARAAAGGPRPLGDLQELGRQMERIGGDVGGGQIDQETLARQDRILGRLLDARNSVRERDYSARRESRTAAGTYRRQEGRSGADEADRDAAARERYQRLENAPLEYRELVRRYFAAVDSLLRGDAPPRAPGAGVLP